MIYKTHLSAKEITLRLKEATEPYWKSFVNFNAEYSYFLVSGGRRSFVIRSVYEWAEQNEFVRRLLPICVKGTMREDNDGTIVEISKPSATHWKDMLHLGGGTALILGYCWFKNIMDLLTAVLCLCLSLALAWLILNVFMLVSGSAKERQFYVIKFLERVLEMEKVEE